MVCITRLRFAAIAVLCVSVVLFVVPPDLTPAAAQNTLQALTYYALTVYSAPERSDHIVGVLNPQAKVILEARDGNAAWVLGRSTDGAVRGWMESRFLDLPSDNSVLKLLVSAEIMFVPTVTNAAYHTINLNKYPTIPINMGRARAIFEQGQRQNLDPHIVSKIGDCISDNRYFLSPFGWHDYNLDSYSQLQGVIDHFVASLAYDSHAAYDGLVTTAVLDPVFANPLACLPGESPLRCEYRVHRPSVAIIMFGAQDLLFTDPEQFEHSLRQIVHESIQAGVIPILSTFPGNLQRWDQTIQYNQIVVQVALDYDIPLMNLWRALESLPNHGLDSDGRHLSPPLTSSGDFTTANLQRGYPLRNLVTLEALDAVWRQVING